MRLQILRLVFLVGSILSLYLGYTWWEESAQQSENLAKELRLLSTARTQIATFEELPPGAELRPRDEALENLLVRLIDETDMLGSSVRIEVQRQGVQWEPVELGVEKAPVTVSSASERTNGLAYFTMLWSIIQEQPVFVRGASIINRSGVITFELELDVYSLGGEG